ncbi:MAG TPA: NAD(P)/FAD-dependent oxidoreductase [Gemmatimonadales bacterium]|nr:NAD(P)/FAD-dependent oxidoreductase [Gemmatimonadales bacterium]
MPSFPMGYDVLVVGAGPAGSATATLLAQDGFSVLVADRASFPRDKACSEYMSPEAVRILARLGVLEALEKAGAFPLEGMKVVGPRGATAHGRFAAAGGAPYRSVGLSISRRILDHELLDSARAAGATILERTCIEELLYEQGTVAGAVARGPGSERRCLRARLTVGADGLRSVVARRIGRRTHGASRRMAFVAHVGGVHGMGASAELHFRDNAYIGLNQIGHDQTNVALVLPAERAVGARQGLEHFFDERLREFPAIHERVYAGQMVRRVLATGPFAVRSKRIIAAGAALVGDAADFFDPATGDGIYSALRGAELLAEAAATALRHPGAPTVERLAEYQRSRQRAFSEKWLLERILDQALRFPRLFDWGVSRLGRHPGMADKVIGFAGGFVPRRDILHPAFLARMLV